MPVRPAVRQRLLRGYPRQQRRRVCAASGCNKGRTARSQYDGTPRPADSRLAGEDLPDKHNAGVLRYSYPAARFMRLPTRSSTTLGSARVETSPNWLG